MVTVHKILRSIYRYMFSIDYSLKMFFGIPYFFDNLGRSSNISSAFMQYINYITWKVLTHLASVK